MRKRLTAGLILILVAFTGLALAAEGHKFRLAQDAQLEGAALKAGKYTIRLNGDNQAEILYRGKVVAQTEVEVQPLPNKAMRNSVLIQSGQISEIRLKDQLILIKGS